MFRCDFEVDAWPRFWRWHLIKICVWTCDMNSTLGSVVPLAMFMHYITLHVIDIHNIRCLEPFLPFYDHFEIWRVLGNLVLCMYLHNLLQMNNPMVNAFFVEIFFQNTRLCICLTIIMSALKTWIAYLFVSYFPFPKFPSSLFSIYYPPSRIQKSHSSRFSIGLLFMQILATISNFDNFLQILTTCVTSTGCSL